MATPLYTQCRHCDTINSTDNAVCSHCHSQLRPLFASNRSWLWVLLGFTLILLVLTNPTEDDLARLLVQQSLSSRSLPRDGGEWIGQNAGMALGEGMVKAVLVRENYLIFSVFHGEPGTPARILGIAGHFWLFR